MAHFLLVRHGLNDWVGRAVAGHLPGIHLNEAGRRQAQALAERLARLPITRVVASPLERTRETAAPIAERHGLPVEVDPGLIEVDIGEWQGRSFDDLDPLPHWQIYNRFRSGHVPPRGEPSVAVQMRMAAVIRRLQAEEPEGVIILVSHGDPICATLAYFAGVPIDLMLRLEVSPASVSVLALHPEGPRLLCMNHTGEVSLRP